MSDEVKKFLDEYCDFVTKVTSQPSLDQDALIKRMKEIDTESDIHSARLLTAALGLGSEGGEFVEIEVRCCSVNSHMFGDVPVQGSLAQQSNAFVWFVPLQQTTSCVEQSNGRSARDDTRNGSE